VAYMTREVRFAEAEPGASARGRNGMIRTSGLMLECFWQPDDMGGKPYLVIRPLTSRGVVSYSCFVEVPLDALPELARVMLHFFETVAGKGGPGVTEVRAPGVGE
jgi:hypothetical protein